tara:strand:+ start:359 stop:589 length:231 start_codon:yes stop_codon:yes gene_type:complete
MSIKDPDKLNVYISNTLGEAVYALENEAKKLTDIRDGVLDNSHLTSSKINLLEQKNLLKELREILRSTWKNKPSAN